MCEVEDGGYLFVRSGIREVQGRGRRERRATEVEEKGRSKEMKMVIKEQYAP